MICGLFRCVLEKKNNTHDRKQDDQGLVCHGVKISWTLHSVLLCPDGHLKIRCG